MVGARNVVGRGTAPRAIVEVSPEQILSWRPDVILAIDRRFYAAVAGDPLWRQLGAVQKKRVHFVPDLPFSWLDDPPAPNRLIGSFGSASCFILRPFPRTSALKPDISMHFSTSRSQAARNWAAFLRNPPA